MCYKDMLSLYIFSSDAICRFAGPEKCDVDTATAALHHLPATTNPSGVEQNANPNNRKALEFQ